MIDIDELRRRTSDAIAAARLQDRLVHKELVEVEKAMLFAANLGLWEAKIHKTNSGDITDIVISRLRSALYKVENQANVYLVSWSTNQTP